MSEERKFYISALWFAWSQTDFKKHGTVQKSPTLWRQPHFSLISWRLPKGFVDIVGTVQPGYVLTVYSNGSFTLWQHKVSCCNLIKFHGLIVYIPYDDHTFSR